MVTTPGEGRPEEIFYIPHEVNLKLGLEEVFEEFLVVWIFGIVHEVVDIKANVDWVIG